MSEVDQILVASIALESVFLLVLLYIWRVLSRMAAVCRLIDDRTRALHIEVRALQLRCDLARPIAKRSVR